MPKMQQGAVLIVGLVMMLLLTIIGLAAIRGGDLQERMAGNMRDLNLAFQAAEAGLRAGEDVQNKVPLPKYDGTVVGYYPDLNTASSSFPPRPSAWTKAQWESKSVLLAANTLSGVAEQPRYVVEQLIVPVSPANQGGAVDIESMEKMADAEYFRITSRGIGGTNDAEVVLQSTFIR
jgi:type IV pilus assembly protein PilX